MLKKLVRVGLVVGAVTLMSAGTAVADEVANSTPAQEKKERNISIYGGLGPAKDASFTESGDTPWAAGVYAGKKYLFGLDIAGEGTSFDSTSGQNSVAEQAWSVNLMLGRSLFKGGDFKLDGGVLVGVRDSSQRCPGGQSYLGFQCYADSDPEASYDVNYGVVLTTSFKAGLIGVRATGESTQALIGFRF